MMKMYKLEVYVYDFEKVDPQDIIYSIEASRYYPVKVMDTQVAEVGEWHDDHPLNKRESTVETFRSYFKGN